MQVSITASVISILSYRHSTEPMETKLWLNELTKIKQYELILYHPDL